MESVIFLISKMKKLYARGIGPVMNFDSNMPAFLDKGLFKVYYTHVIPDVLSQ